MTRSIVLMSLISLAVACGDSEPAPKAEPAPAAKAPAKPAPAPKAEEKPAEPAAAATPEERGKALFNQPLIGSQAGCMTCHKVDTDDKLVGPSLKGLSERAATRVEGQSADDYIKASILKPNDYVVEGFVQGLMPAGYEGELSEEQLGDLMAYLKTL